MSSFFEFSSRAPFIKGFMDFKIEENKYGKRFSCCASKTLILCLS